MGIWENQSYRKIEQQSCGKMNGYCNTFSKLYLAGVIVILIQGIFLILCSILGITFILNILNKDYDKKLLRILVILTPLFQIIGLVTWIGVSGANFNGNCHDNATTMQNEYRVCGTDGPILMIISILLALVTIVCYFVIRHGNKIKSQNKIIPLPKIN